MNHFMKYDEAAENNPQPVLNEMLPQQQQPGIHGVLNRPQTGVMQRGQRRFDQQINRAVMTPQKGAQLLAQNLQSILANDPKAEQKKRRIVWLLYQQVIKGNVQVSPEDQQA